MNSKTIWSLVVTLLLLAIKEMRAEEVLCDNFYGHFHSGVTLGNASAPIHFLKRDKHFFPIKIGQNSEIESIGERVSAQDIKQLKNISGDATVYFNVVPQRDGEYLLCYTNESQEIVCGQQSYEKIPEFTPSFVFIIGNNTLMFVSKGIQEFKCKVFVQKKERSVTKDGFKDCDPSANASFEAMKKYLGPNVDDIFGVLYLAQTSNHNERKFMVFRRTIRPMQSCIITQNNNEKPNWECKEFQPCINEDAIYGYIYISVMVFYFIVLFIIPMTFLLTRRRVHQMGDEIESTDSETSVGSDPSLDSDPTLGSKS